MNNMTATLTENEKVAFFLQKADETEQICPYEAKSWLLAGETLLQPSSVFPIQYRFYEIEKKLKNVKGTSEIFETLFKSFPVKMSNEVVEMADAVNVIHTKKGQETPEQLFLNEVFSSLPKSVRLELLMQRSKEAKNQSEKIYGLLLIVKLYPDTVNQHGTDLLYTLLACDSDVHSSVRKVLVEELVPAVLQLSTNLGASKSLITLLNQSIEFYVLVQDSANDSISSCGERWEKLYAIVDKVGTILSWHISPFFTSGSTILNSTNPEVLYQNLCMCFQHRKHYSVQELGYITVVVLLKCVITYWNLVHRSQLSSDGSSKMTLVEIFTPKLQLQQKSTASVVATDKVITTVSSCSTVTTNHTSLLQHFHTACDIWKYISVSCKGDKLEKEIMKIITSVMHSINFESWNIFRDFTLDFKTYTGGHLIEDTKIVSNLVKQASIMCSIGQYRAAAEFAINAVSELQYGENSNSSISSSQESNSSISSSSTANNTSTTMNHRQEDFGFFNSHAYTKDTDGQYLSQRRVHFLSENRGEIVAYATNILVACFKNCVEPGLDVYLDEPMGYLLTLVQLEWPSPPVKVIFKSMLQKIRTKGSFRFSPYFSKYIIEPAFLEQFMALSNHDSKTVTLDLFSTNGSSSNASGSTSRRMGTRGVEKGKTNDFRKQMRAQMMKNGREKDNVEHLIFKFITENKNQILESIQVK